MTKILLVEDDKSLREIYGVRLLAEGYDIVSAGDGEEALAMAIKERPQLIVSDVMMPKISGFDMLDILRSTTETKDIKVIMMTALSSEDQRARGQALGADRYLVKSQVGIEDVVRTVHEVLKDAPVSTPSTAPVNNTGTPRPPAPSAPRPVPTLSSSPPQPAQPTRPLASPTSAQQSPASFQTALPHAAPAAPPASSLPQPTAPFSTARPANLGERVIHPIVPTSQQNGKPDVGSLIDQELNKVSDEASSFDDAGLQAPPPPPVPPTPPVAPPSTPAAPQQTSTAQPSTESEISFEETPRPAPTPQSSDTFTPGAQPPRS